MINKRLILISYCLLLLSCAIAQCPEKKWLYNRLIFLRDSSSSISLTQKLKELLTYESKIQNCNYLYDTTCALLLQRIGAAYYTQKDFAKAIQFTKQSINILSNIPRNENYLLKNYANLVIFYDSINNIFNKKSAIDSCILIGGRLSNVEETYLIALEKKVPYLFYTGNYSFCYKYASMGEEACKIYNKHNRELYLVYFFTWKINTLISDKKYEIAERFLINALKDTTNFKFVNPANIYEQLAQVMIHKASSKEALIYFKKALQYDDVAKNTLGCMETLNNLGFLYYYKYVGNFAKALQAYKHALRYRNKGPSDQLQKWASLNILANIASVYVMDKLYDSAFRYFQLSFNEIKPGINETYLSDSLMNFYLKNGDAEYLTNLIIDKGDAYLARFKNKRNIQDITKAVKTYKVADQLLEKIKINQIELESKLSWRKNFRRLYDHAIDACYEANNTNEAFFFFEKSRAVLLSDQLHEQNFAGKEYILVAEQLKKNIVKNENALKEIFTQDTLYKQRYNNILEGKQKLFNLQEAIKISDPLYYQNFIDSNLITVSDVQHLVLKNHKALIEIYSADSAVYTLIIKANEINFTKIDKKDFDNTANQFINYLSNSYLLNKNFNAFLKTSAYLYSLIFKGNTLPPGRIIISPDGRYFPFEALITSAGKNINYLINSNAVSYTYSSRYLLNQFNNTAPANAPDFFGIAPINYPKNWNLAPLNNFDQSLNRLQNYFYNADVKVFKDATKNNFIKNFTKYKIVQLFTHGADTTAFGEPVIYFADSILFLSELIAGEKPATNLILLSACYSGAGKLNVGEGVFSFNRAFAATGIPASINNLWAADNISVIEITELFYKYLNEGEATDVALQKAKLEFLNSTSEKNKLPYYWAGIILTGKSGNIEFNKPIPWLIIFLTILIILLALFVFRKLLFANELYMPRTSSQKK